MVISQSFSKLPLSRSEFVRLAGDSSILGAIRAPRPPLGVLTLVRLPVVLPLAGRLS
jgi:hypothetical protein